MILWMLPDQMFWAGRLKRLKVGTGRRFLATTEKTLVKDLREILNPEHVDNARRLAAQMTTSAASAANAADLLENYARSHGR